MTPSWLLKLSTRLLWKMGNSNPYILRRLVASCSLLCITEHTEQQSSRALCRSRDLGSVRFSPACPFKLYYLRLCRLTSSSVPGPLPEAFITPIHNNSELVGHHLLAFLSTGKDCAMYIYTRQLIPFLDTVYGGLRPSMAISDVEVSDSSLPETRSVYSSRSVSQYSYRL
jgi:hypothetical protein